MSVAFPVGSLVQFRDRHWVVQSLEDDDVLTLRPLDGSEHEACAVYVPLQGHLLRPADFPLPDPERTGDFTAVRLLRDAARLSLRSGAGPFRCMGRISVHPRPYQLVPLIMALRLSPVRLLIADDVGVGKTVEAGLIAKELLERGEAKRLCVLCPPHLCEQWQREMAEKFHIDAVIVRTSTWTQLDRRVPRGGPSVYGYFPYLVVSIDFAKGAAQRPWFVHDCPDLVIVDEAHGAARPPATSGRAPQQQRHELLRELAKDRSRHLILLTATPHSGVRESFASLLGLLDPELEPLVREGMTDEDRRRIARHFVQRKRSDIEHWLGEQTTFPKRDPKDVAYHLDPEALALFEDVFAFTKETVYEPGLARHRQRVRYWGALALLRCLMSSPAAAVEALARREAQEEAAEGSAGGEGTEEDALDELRRREVLDALAEEAIYDTVPEGAVFGGMRDLGRRDRQRLAEFRRRAEELLKSGRDGKLDVLVKEVRQLLREGFHPIVYCRFIATARYVAERLAQRLGEEYPTLRVLAVTGEMPDEERAARVAELEQSPRRILVATDCLSEGIDLQRAFNAVIHYDLPWNPNRLEQREGRVDRFGQSSPVVRTVLLYGANNRIDLTVLEVLIKKARKIREDLGITVPVPVDSESVVEALIRALFEEGSRRGEQLRLPIEAMEFQQAWERAAKDEDENRKLFAQHGIPLDEVKRLVEETREVLGDPALVRRFFVDAAQRFRLPVWGEGDTLWARPDAFPPMSLQRPLSKDRVRLAFDVPAPEDAVVLGRNHPWVSWLADRVLGEALAPADGGTVRVARCGAIATDAVRWRTALVLLRLRYRLRSKGRPELYAEEVVTCGFRREAGQLVWLEPNGEEALRLLDGATPTANLDPGERRDAVAWALELLMREQEALAGIARRRAERLAEAHGRLRGLTGDGAVEVDPYPPDVLGLYVLVPGGGSR